jgi:hypothetical protein
MGMARSAWCRPGSARSGRGGAKVRDRGAGETGAERIRFTSAILPRWSRRTRSLDALLPILYLRGVSIAVFQKALRALLGRDAPNLIRALAVARPVGPALRRRCRFDGE